MEISTTKCWQTGQLDDMLDVLPFEAFFLGELLAEGIIDKELFDLTYQQLASNLNLDKKGLEMEK